MIATRYISARRWSNGVEVKGLGALLAKLNSMGGNVDTAIEKGTRSAAGFIRDAAKMNCTADTGTLRASIHSQYQRDGSTHKGIVSTNCEYAPYVEFGTGPTGNGTYPYPVPGLRYKADKWLGKIPDIGWRWVSGQVAQPYLYPALRDNKGEVLKRYEQAITREIVKAAKK